MQLMRYRLPCEEYSGGLAIEVFIETHKLRPNPVSTLTRLSLRSRLREGAAKSLLAVALVITPPLLALTDVQFHEMVISKGIERHKRNVRL
jgi:hypothetical protein